jgi:hypothetical protein
LFFLLIVWVPCAWTLVDIVILASEDERVQCLLVYIYRNWSLITKIPFV